MNEETQKKILEHLDALAILLKPVGYKFNLATIETDEQGEVIANWEFDITRLEAK